MYQVDLKTVIGDIIAQDPMAAEVFFGMGMFCVGCPASQSESIEEACMVHGLDPVEMVDQLNAYFAETAK